MEKKTKIHGNYVFIQDEQLTIVVVPGIANCTETKYVRTFTGYAMQHGFKVAVLNHLGAKKKESLSTPRIFTYGNWKAFMPCFALLLITLKLTHSLGESLIES